jgi:hypothetical protein
LTDAASHRCLFFQSHVPTRGHFLKMWHYGLETKSIYLESVLLNSRQGIGYTIRMGPFLVLPTTPNAWNNAIRRRACCIMPRVETCGPIAGQREMPSLAIFASNKSNETQGNESVVTILTKPKPSDLWMNETNVNGLA